MDCSQIKYPIYIISKNRFDVTLSANMFLRERIPFKIAVEPQEYKQYCESVGKENVLELPFSNLGLGSYPARNHCWEDSIKNGFKKHFLFDDNIRGFYRLNKGERKKTETLPALLCLQELTDRYSNLAITGYNYLYFANKETNKPFTINTHVYSGMLINNEIPFRWRLKYNEDVDLCLQALHTKKWCTILLNAFLIDKVSTVTMMKGGNQDELYKNNHPKKKILKSKSLELMWPQYVKTVLRFNRPHHHVSWNKHFNHPLKKIVTAHNKPSDTGPKDTPQNQV